MADCLAIYEDLLRQSLVAQDDHNDAEEDRLLDLLDDLWKSMSSDEREACDQISKRVTAELYGGTPT